MNSRLVKLFAGIVLVWCGLTFGLSPLLAAAPPVPKPAPRGIAHSVRPQPAAEAGKKAPAETKAGAIGTNAPANPSGTRSVETSAASFAPDQFAKVNLSGEAGVIELQHLLRAHRFGSADAGGDGNALWYLFAAVNDSNLPAVRILLAGQPPGAGARLMPSPVRPAVLQLASTNPNAVIENAPDYGAGAYRLSLPPHASAVVAARMQGAEDPPSLLAWTEPALAAHNRWVAIFVAAVAGLIAAAAVLAGGMAVMTRQLPPRLTALMLISLFLMRLSPTGLFDEKLATQVGGPDGLTALFAGLSLMAGLRLIDCLLPVGAMNALAPRRLHQSVYVIVAIAVLAYLGLPGATLAVNTICVLASVAAAVYVVACWRRRMSAARALAPAAVMFAAYGLLSGYVALGGFGGAMVPDVAGGFLAAGAILLVLALVTGVGAGLMGMRHIPAPVFVSAPPPVPHAAIEAIGASFQGVFELDISKDSVKLSREAAALFGLGLRVHNMRGDTWRARLHPDDRPVYEKAIADFRSETDYAFRIEFRARDEAGHYLWFELRATMKGSASGPAQRCVGLIADVTMRKEAEAEALDRTLRDPQTGLGNRVALMKVLDGMGVQLSGIVCALVDIDGFRHFRADMGDACSNALLAHVADRLDKHFRASTRVFRIGGDSFAVVLDRGRDAPAAMGAEMTKFCAEPYTFDGKSHSVTVSIGIAEGLTARDPLDLINNAELALRQAQCLGSGCARVFAAGMEVMAPSDAAGIVPALQQAVRDGAIEVLYRPVLRLHDRTVAGFEAVLRWQHPQWGAVSPDDLVSHSGDAALISALGRYGLRRAAADLTEWQRYFPLSEPLFVTVRVLPQLWAGEDFPDALAEDLGQPPAQPLVLALSGDAYGLSGSAARLTRLHAAGAGLALCDFSGDPAPLEDLKSLPFDIVRIDTAFLTRQSGDRVAALVAAARKARSRVIVENLESEDEAAYVVKLGCELGQGGLFSVPLTAEETITFIARNFRPADSEISA